MLLRAFDALIGRFAALFEPTPATPARERWELPALLLIVALGAVLRFWGLGAVGLHGDEETMAMPVMHIIEHGSSQFPSGMYYGRAIAQLYLMAGSVMVFGESEWALRLPSALCGVLLIGLVYLLGRRFLPPAWNLAFVATVAFLPDLIVVSQTARMYIFLQAALAGYAVLVFAWERTERIGYLAAAVAMLILGLQFHTLAIFAAFLLFFPGLLRGERGKLLLGAAAFLVALLGYQWISSWYHAFYPMSLAPSAPVLEDQLVERNGLLRALEFGVAPLALGALAAAALSGFVLHPVRGTGARIATGLLVFAALAAQLALSYHLALLLLLAGAVVALRHGPRAVWLRLGVMVALSALLAVVHIWVLQAQGIESLRKIFGAMAGQPSVWAYANLGAYSPGALVLVGLGLAGAAWRLATGRKIADAWLFFVLAAWLPVFLIGFFMWYPPSRYMDFALLPLLLCALAAARALLQSFSAVRQPARAAPAPAPAPALALALIAGAVIINPVTFARTWNAGYAIHPDHKGAAQFIRSIDLGPQDILVAEDVLQQTYYLGRVDYWLMGEHIGLKYCEEVEGHALDFYTHTPLIGTGAALMALVERSDRGAIYVIGSGENFEDGRRHMRAFGIHETLASPEFEPVFRGRDGHTQVWRVAPPAAPSGLARAD